MNNLHHEKRFLLIIFFLVIGSFLVFSIVKMKHGYLDEYNEFDQRISDSMNNYISIKNNNKKSMKFLVLGDYGRDGLYGQKETAKQMNNYSKLFRPDFIMGTGDNIYRSGVKSPHSHKFKTSIEYIYFIYNSLRIPWYNVLGNHDYKHNPNNEILYAKKSKYWNMPHRYYNLVYGNWIEFFFIDTNEYSPRLWLKKRPRRYLKRIKKHKQYKWLKNKLKSSHAKWKIVVGHHPFVSSGFRGAKFEKHGESPMQDKFDYLFQKYKVDLYFSGHEHILEHLKSDETKVNYFISGAGSKTSSIYKVHPDSLYAKGNTDGFMSVRIKKNRCIVKFIDAKGNVIYQTIINNF